MTLLDPRTWLAMLVAGILCVSGGYRWGKHATENAVAAGQQKSEAHTAAVEATRDDHIEAIGVAASQRADLQLDDIKVHTDESVPKILTVVLPAVCRDKPAVVVRELTDETDRINADIRSGLRQRATVDPATGTGHGTGAQRVGARGAGPVP